MYLSRYSLTVTGVSLGFEWGLSTTQRTLLVHRVEVFSDEDVDIDVLKSPTPTWGGGISPGVSLDAGEDAGFQLRRVSAVPVDVIYYQRWRVAAAAPLLVNLPVPLRVLSAEARNTLVLVPSASTSTASITLNVYFDEY